MAGLLTAIRSVAIDGGRQIGRARIVRGLRSHRGVRERVVSLEALAGGAQRKAVAAFPPRGTEAATFADPEVTQIHFGVH